jgi:hypothetical protein
MKLAEIVKKYKKNHQEGAAKEQRWFAIRPNLEEAVKQAALARSPS